LHFSDRWMPVTKQRGWRFIPMFIRVR